MIRILELVGAFVILVALPFLLVRRVRPGTDRNVQPEVCVVGGGATWHTGVVWPYVMSGPIVQLEAYQWGLAVCGGPSRLVGWVVPRVELEWKDIVEIARRPTGLRIVRADHPRQSIVFNLMPSSRDDLLGQLSKYPLTITT